MPTISQFYGIIISMFFNEHNPPHFHVQYGEYGATINIKNGSVKGELPRRALVLVYDWLDLHKEELLENWELLQSGGDYKKIQPLE